MGVMTLTTPSTTLSEAIEGAREIASSTGRRQKVAWSRARRCFVIREVHAADVLARVT